MEFVRGENFFSFNLRYHMVGSDILISISWINLFCDQTQALSRQPRIISTPENLRISPLVISAVEGAEMWTQSLSPHPSRIIILGEMVFSDCPRGLWYHFTSWRSSSTRSRSFFFSTCRPAKMAEYLRQTLFSRLQFVLIQMANIICWGFNDTPLRMFKFCVNLFNKTRLSLAKAFRSFLSREINFFLAVSRRDQQNASHYVSARENIAKSIVRILSSDLMRISISPGTSRRVFVCSMLADFCQKILRMFRRVYDRLDWLPFGPDLNLSHNRNGVITCPIKCVTSKGECKNYGCKYALETRTHKVNGCFEKN